VKGVVSYIFILLHVFTFSQDIHFSQYFYSPLTLNPSNAGNVEADWRFVNNYRNQWKSLSIPYRTIAVSYEHQWYIYSEQLSYAINVIDDRSGPAGLTINKLFLTLAYHKKINYSNWHIGIQGGMVFKKFSLNELTFPSQFDMTSGYFNSQLYNYETNLQTHENYPDLNIGISWNKQIRQVYPEIGLSFFHLILPKESFFNDNYQTGIRNSIHAGVLVPIKSFYLKPQAFQMRQKKATDLILGLEFGFNIKNNNFLFKRIFAGFFVRNDFSTSFDANIFMIGAQIKHWQIALSYDINTSSLAKATNNRGAFEFSIIYTSKSTIPKKITIPCERM